MKTPLAVKDDSHQLLSRLGQGLLVVFLAALPLYPPVLRGHGLDATFWLTNLLVVTVLGGVYYFNLLFAVPRLLFRGHWALYALLVVALILSLTVMTLRVAARPAGPHGRQAAPTQAVPDRAVRLRREGGATDGEAVCLLSTALLLGAGTMRAISQRSQQETERRRVAETGRLEVELAYLRAQLNPHVFFNTLNSIYVLTELNVGQARQAIIRLSRLMRYVLYQTQEARVPLHQEVVFLEDYVGLMQLRLTPNMRVEFEHAAELRDVLLAPMLLQPFVENAFKYGVSTAQPATIFINLSQAPESRALVFEVRNQIFTTPTTGFATGSGIGLANTRRRLALLYPLRHELCVTQRNEAGEFVIHLTLHLT